MPLITRVFLRTALVYFVAALAVGTLDTLDVVAPALRVAGLRPVYFHLLMVGWVTQLIIGVALWMFPKYSSERPRGSDTLSWVTYGLLNAGLILRALAEPLLAGPGGAVWGWLLAASAVLQMLAGWLFVANTWPRVRER